VYWKLKELSPDESRLSFDVLASLTEQPDGTLHPGELKRLIRLLRPDRDGLYKQEKLLIEHLSTVLSRSTVIAQDSCRWPISSRVLMA
jgi:hypothetical protein